MQHQSASRSDRPLVRCILVACLLAMPVASNARAQTTPFQPASPQPTLPPRGGPKPTSQVVESLMSDRKPVLNVQRASRHERLRREAHGRLRHFARHDTVVPPIERPALAGVELLQALPRPGEPPHIVVPLPAYALDSLVTPATTPLPPVVCHPIRRDPDLPDPRLYRERIVSCEADNP